MLHGDLLGLLRLRKDGDQAECLSRQDVPLGRRLQRLHKAAAVRLGIVLKGAAQVAHAQALAVPLDRVALGARRVLAQRNERHGKVLPDVLAQHQVRNLPLRVVLGGEDDQAADRHVYLWLRELA